MTLLPEDVIRLSRIERFRADGYQTMKKDASSLAHVRPLFSDVLRLRLETISEESKNTKFKSPEEKN
ncbi:hypothetical protein [uncultured Sutterella sp.]|uniref:hypothetical protein n=1 Tax=uncultured Sutterella sp. TaxID=286133 RepID=UPI00261388D5|nr:hypothetical protein [uncultured Sutterella sp.]